MTQVRVETPLRGSAFRVAKIVLVTVWAAGLSTASSTFAPPNKSVLRRVAPHRMVVARAKPPAPIAVEHAVTPSAFAREAAMNGSERMVRWNPFIKEAARRFRIPENWIRAILTIESGGRTMLAENMPMTSSAGAMGLMQVMPQTWQQMRQAYGLGADPYDPRDNILAGTAYLQLLYRQYGYPALFAAYNDGPGMLEAHRRMRQFMPDETTAYVLDIASILSRGVRRNSRLANGVPGPEANGAPFQGAVGAYILIPATPQHEPGGNSRSDDDEEH